MLIEALRPEERARVDHRRVEVFKLPTEKDTNNLYEDVGCLFFPQMMWRPCVPLERWRCHCEYKMGEQKWLGCKTGGPAYRFAV